MTFRDRDDAGRRLAERLVGAGFEDPVVLALPRGGVPVAAHVARALDAPLEVFVARKVGAPGQPEFGIGAIAEGSDEVVVSAAGRQLGIDTAQLRYLVERERRELTRRVDLYRGTAALPPLKSRDVILVDDGLATGVTAEAALRSLRGYQPRRLVLAAPVCPPETARRLATVADDVVCVESPVGLGSIGAWYVDFSQISDDRVLDLLADFRSRTRTTGDQSDLDPPVTLDIPGAGTVRGDLVIPADARGVIVFAHGSGSGRHSPRNRSVARALQQRGFATLLMDLLTESEEQQDALTGRLRFDIGLLAERLELASQRLADDPATAGLPIGYFGASTGAAAALTAAVKAEDRVFAIVSRGGRPDLAGDVLRDVHTPTLLIVGSLDQVVLALNQQALERLGGQRDLQVVPGASHLFEEPGTLDEVARLAGDWFLQYLPERATGSASDEAQGD